MSTIEVIPLFLVTMILLPIYAIYDLGQYSLYGCDHSIDKKISEEKLSKQVDPMPSGELEGNDRIQLEPDEYPNDASSKNNIIKT